jgi:hypothetical protein
MVAPSAFVSGTVLCGTEVANLVRANKYDGVSSGLTPSQRAAGVNMSADIASGYYFVSGVRYSYAGGNQAITAADATNPRWDIISFSSAGIVYTAGTAAANPMMPALSANQILVASIYVSAGTTSILDASIRDERVTLSTYVPKTPVGTIVAWAKSLTGVPVLPAGWHECDGSVVSDVNSPLNGTTLPNLNSGTQRFLRGSTTSGTTGGADTVNPRDTTHDVGTTDTTGWYAKSSISILPSYYEVVWIICIY